MSSYNERSRWSHNELIILEAFATADLKPNRAQRDFLATMLNSGVRRTQIWFQNQRANEKKTGPATKTACQKCVRLPSPSCMAKLECGALDNELYNEIYDELVAALDQSDPALLKELGDKVYFYTEQTIEYLRANDLEQSLGVLTNVMLSFMQMSFAKAVEKKSFAIIVNTMAETLKHWARCAAARGTDEIEHLCFAVDVAAAFAMFLDKRALGSTMISCRSTLVAAIIIAIGDQVLNPNGTLGNGTRVLVPCVVRAALAGDGGTAKEMHELADKSVTLAAAALSHDLLLAAIGAVLPSALATPRACVQRGGVVVQAAEPGDDDDDDDANHSNASSRKSSFVGDVDPANAAAAAAATQAIIKHENELLAAADGAQKRKRTNSRRSPPKSSQQARRRVASNGAKSNANDGDDEDDDDEDYRTEPCNLSMRSSRQAAAAARLKTHKLLVEVNADIDDDEDEDDDDQLQQSNNNNNNNNDNKRNRAPAASKEPRFHSTSSSTTNQVFSSNTSNSSNSINSNANNNNSNNAQARFTDTSLTTSTSALAPVRDEPSIPLNASTISLGDMSTQPWFREELFRASTVAAQLETNATVLQNSSSVTPISSDSDATLSPDLVGNEWAHAITDEEFSQSGSRRPSFDEFEKAVFRDHNDELSRLTHPSTFNTTTTTPQSAWFANSVARDSSWTHGVNASATRLPSTTANPTTTSTTNDASSINNNSTISGIARHASNNGDFAQQRRGAFVLL